MKSSRAQRVHGSILVLLITNLLTLNDAKAGTLKVRVRDARDGSAIAGAFVQVGPVAGVPMAGNTGTTAADGVVIFSDPRLNGPQTVTAAAGGYARFTVIEAALDSIALPLHTEVSSSAIHGPRAMISGTVQNIATLSNDSNLDIGIVYPAVRLDDLLSSGNLPVDAPLDTVNFPLVGQTVLPGNIVVPTQTEGFIFQFSKPNYHFFVADNLVYDFVVVAGRLPLAGLSGPDALNALVMREVGIERQIAVAGDRTLTINSDLDQTRNLTVSMPEAVAGSEMRVFSLADIAEPAGTLTLFFDTKSGIAGQAASLLLSGRNPTGDLSTAVPYLFGSYHDSSAADAWEAGRLDRTSLTLPATRTIGDFFLLPDLTAIGDVFSWSDVSRPGITPSPTWAVGRIELEPVTPGDTTVTSHTLWEVQVAAGRGSFSLPLLPAGAPGGIPEPADTPEADEIVWSHLIHDPAGSVQQVIDGAASTVTRFSRRTIPIANPLTGVREPGGAPSAGRIELGPAFPNPFGGRTEFAFEVCQAGPVRVTVFDLQGRAVRGLESRILPAGRYALGWDGLDDGGRRSRAGVYFLRLAAGGEVASRRLVLTR